MKRTLCSALCLAMAVILLPVGCGGGSAAAKFSAAMVTDVGGVNDESFNQSAWMGMKKLETELGAKISFIESHKDADYAPNLEKKG